MHLDFISFHPYPMVADPINTSEITLGIDRVLSEIYWYAHNINLPWMLGETGFSAMESPGERSGVDGNYYGQEDFAELTLTAARSCGAAGYTWWQYQNVYWGSNLQDNFGLIDHDDVLKPAVDAFHDFDPNNVQTSCTQPSNYYNYFNYSTTPVTGTVSDNYGNPIQDAVVWGWSNYNSGDGLCQTFTRQDGSYTLYPTSAGINAIKASAVSSNVGIIFPIQTPPFGPYDFTASNSNPLTFPVNYNLDESNQTYTVIDPDTTFTAPNVITASDFIVDGNGTTGGTVTMVAGGSIELQPEFEAKAGSTFHAYIAPVPPDCNDNAFKRKISPENSVSNIFVTTKVEQPAEVKFLLSPTIYENVQLSPNPAPNQVLIQITEEDDNDKDTPWQLIIYNISGKLIYQCSINKPNTMIDISGFASGIYLAKIMKGNSCYTKKIIHQ